MARILVIEDNPTNLDLMTYLLQAFGHTPLTAADGEAGLGLARREMPDLILCDVQIPKLDGCEVAKLLKSHRTLRAIPLVAVTALAMVGDRDKLLAAGFDGYIPKPIAPETFVGQVEAFLLDDKSSTAQQPASPPTVAAATTTTSSRRATILCVDNSPTNNQLLHRLLEHCGYNVISAPSIREGLTLAWQFAPDLIMSDLYMPDGDGFQFIRQVKADAQLSAIPFVFLSATVRRGTDYQKGLDLGAAKFILRPIEPQNLLAEIEECLRARAGA